MKTLMLMRHAKSDWSGNFRTDHDRPLNKRGKEAAPLMGTFLKNQKLVPDKIYCSTAKRTEETCDLLVKALNRKVDIDYSDALYGASDETLLDHAMSADPDCDRILLIAHNPGLHELALELISDSAEGVDRHALQGNFPTAALAVFAFDVSRWEDVAPHTGHLICYQTPRDLT